MTAPLPAPGSFPRTTAPDRPRRGGIAGRHQLAVVGGAATLLASAPMLSLFQGLSWLVHSAFAVAAVVAAGCGARALRAPVAVQALAMLGALVLAVTWLFRSGGEFLFLPTAATLAHFDNLLAEVPDVIARETVPVRTGDGLLLLTVLGVGLVAVLVDLAAVGARRPALAGLPMLAVYSVPVAVHLGSVPWYTFAIGVAGYLWLLGADSLDRVRRFGRRFTGDGRDVEQWEPSPLAAAGRRLTVIGLVIAVALPVAVPGMTTGLVDRFGSGLGPGGEGGRGGPPTAVNLFAALDGLLNRDEIVELVRFTTDDPDPFYLRIGVADRITERGFDHRAPQGGPLAEAVPGPRQDRPGVTYHAHRAEVEVLGWDMNRVPSFAELTGISGLDGRWRYDPGQKVVFADEAQASGLSYSFEYQRPEFDPQVLRRVRPLAGDHPVQREFAQIIPEERVSEQVDQLIDGIDSPYQQVLAILGFFSRSNGFSYSLDTGSEVTGSAIVDFLFENKTGYCVQYAAGMAWMVRDAGLPARVAVGFTKGNQRTGNTYLLTNHNLHAWTEVYLDGYGWVPFDATPRGSIAGSADPPWAPDPNAPPDPDGPDGPIGSGSAESGGDLPGDNTLDNLAPEPGGGSAGPLADQSRWQSWLLAAAVLVAVLLVLPSLRRAQLRRRRLPRRLDGRPGTAPDGAPAAGMVASGEPTAAARHRAHEVWDELLDTMIDYRVPLNQAETPRVTADRLIRECQLAAGPAPAAGRPAPTGPPTPAAGRPAAPTGPPTPAAGRPAAPAGPPTPAAGAGMRLLGHAEERARYSRQPLPAAGLVEALTAVRRALAGRATRRVRLRAVLLPPSTLLRWRTAAADRWSGAALAANRWGETVARVSPRRLLHSRTG
jgi:transglutaminase-like putative cysteine protease